MWDKTERRTHRRKPAEIDVNLRFADGQVLATGKVNDLSLGGVFIQMVDPLPLGTDVEIEFLLSVKPHIIRCPGTVVWSSDELDAPDPERSGIGVQLRQLGPTELKFLTSLLNQTPEPDGPL